MLNSIYAFDYEWNHRNCFKLEITNLPFNPFAFDTLKGH